MKEPFSAYSDRQLLELIRNENIHAFNALFDRYWHTCYTSAYKSLKDKDQCKAIVHDVFLNIWERRLVIEIENPEAYLRSAIRFRVINYIVRRKDNRFYELFDSIGVSSHNPENYLLEKETLLLIESWIKVLPARRREIFIRHFFNQLSTRQIAHEMNISQKTVQNQLAASIHYLYSHFSHLISRLSIVVFLQSLAIF